jgi:hypothetical protein
VNFFDADGLSGEDCAEVDFFLAETNAATTRDYDGFIVQRIVDVRQSGVGAVGGLIDFDRAFHGERFVRTLVVEDIDKLVEAGLLLQEIAGGGFRSFFLQSEMHAFMTAVLLGMTWFDAFDANVQA